MKKNTITPITLIAIIVLAGGAMFLLNSKLATTSTEVTKSQASMATPKLTESYVDSFKTEAINENKWSVSKSTDVSAAQTAGNNLNITIPEGNQSGHPKAASILFKEYLKDNADFRAIAVLYRPIVTGTGGAVEGIRFSSKGSLNDEGASIRWVVKGTSSRVSFTVASTNGTVVERKTANLPTNIAIFRLERVNKAYRASYKLGNDLSSDSNWIILGEEENQSLGADGYISLFANNGAVKNQFPKVVARFDTARLHWEGKAAQPSTRISFSDAFSNGNIGAKWKASATAGTAVVETKTDNLTMNVAAGAVKTKPRAGWVKRAEPVVKNNKDFAVNAQVFKPVVKGDGYGVSILSFQSTTTLDDEAAVVRWVVSKNENISRLVFAVRAPDNTLLERASVDIKDIKANKLTLHLKRVGNTYQAAYRAGDDDADFVSIGKEENGHLGGDGHIVLSTNNTGIGHKFPQVIGRFDSVSGWVEK